MEQTTAAAAAAVAYRRGALSFVQPKYKYKIDDRRCIRAHRHRTQRGILTNTHTDTMLL